MCSLYVPTHRKAPNLNLTPTYAPEKPEERIQRHQAVCRRLIELGMQLAEAAAERALQAPPEPAPPSQPGAAAPAGPATSRHALIFAHLARTIRQAVALEARLATEADTLASNARLAAHIARAEAPPKPIAPPPPGPDPLARAVTESYIIPAPSRPRPDPALDPNLVSLWSQIIRHHATDPP